MAHRHGGFALVVMSPAAVLGASWPECLNTITDHNAGTAQNGKGGILEYAALPILDYCKRVSPDDWYGCDDFGTSDFWTDPNSSPKPRGRSLFIYAKDAEEGHKSKDRSKLPDGRDAQGWQIVHTDHDNYAWNPPSVFGGCPNDQAGWESTNKFCPYPKWEERYSQEYFRNWEAPAQVGIVSMAGATASQAKMSGGYSKTLLHCAYICEENKCTDDDQNGFDTTTSQMSQGGNYNRCCVGYTQESAGRCWFVSKTYDLGTNPGGLNQNTGVNALPVLTVVKPKYGPDDRCSPTFMPTDAAKAASDAVTAAAADTTAKQGVVTAAQTTVGEKESASATAESDLAKALDPYKAADAKTALDALKAAVTDAETAATGATTAATELKAAADKILSDAGDDAGAKTVAQAFVDTAQDEVNKANDLATKITALKAKVTKAEEDEAAAKAKHEAALAAANSDAGRDAALVSAAVAILLATTV